MAPKANVLVLQNEKCYCITRINELSILYNLFITQWTGALHVCSSIHTSSPPAVMLMLLHKDELVQVDELHYSPQLYKKKVFTQKLAEFLSPVWFTNISAAVSTLTFWLPVLFPLCRSRQEVTQVHDNRPFMLCPEETHAFCSMSFHPRPVWADVVWSF